MAMADDDVTQCVRAKGRGRTVGKLEDGELSYMSLALQAPRPRQCHHTLSWLGSIPRRYSWPRYWLSLSVLLMSDLTSGLRGMVSGVEKARAMESSLIWKLWTRPRWAGVCLARTHLRICSETLWGRSSPGRVLVEGNDPAAPLLWVDILER